MSEATDTCAAAATALFLATATLGEQIVTGTMTPAAAQRIVRSVRGLIADLARENGDCAFEDRAAEYLAAVARFLGAAEKARATARAARH